MSVETKSPIARVCGCDSCGKRKAKVGDAVYLKERGTLTLNSREAAREHVEPIGKLVAGNGGLQIKLSSKAEEALGL